MQGNARKSGGRQKEEGGEFRRGSPPGLPKGGKGVKWRGGKKRERRR